MAASPKKQLALDVNVLLDLAEGWDFAQDFREEFLRRGYGLFVTPTAAGELNILSLYAAKPTRSFALQALQELRRWEIQPCPLSDLNLAIAERFSRRLVERRLIPEEEWNDGRILGETSVSGIPLLVTSDKHLLDIDDDALLLVFNEADLPPVRPAHPKRLLRAVR
jgi:hypothetical protein